MTDSPAPSVRTDVTVPLSQREAFALFTERLSDFKPPEHHLLPAPLASTVLEPRVGGGIVDRGIDGSECRWGRVLVFDPPALLVFSWDIGTTWELETDLDRSSEVAVSFEALDERSTRVQIEHRHLDRHGPGWESTRSAVAGDNGWPLYLRRFAVLAASGTPA